MRHFLVVIHDASPAHAREMDRMLRDLHPLIGRRLSAGVVPDWHGAWPLAAHPGFCRRLADASGEVLLHGYSHRRARGRGPVSWLTGGADEMNGLDVHATRRTIELGQRALAEAFGAPADGFLPPAWQAGQLRGPAIERLGLSYLLGYLSLRAPGARALPLATWSWDCGRWGRLGHAGHQIGRMLASVGGRTPVLAIHPRDLERGFWPRILRLARRLLDAGFLPVTPGQLLTVSHADRAA